MTTCDIARALDYPGWEVLSHHQQQVSRELRRYVSFLEHRIIRFYQQNERQICDDTIANSKWKILFDKYLKDLGCPLTTTNTSTLEAQLQWLSGNAVSLAFEDLPVEERTFIDQAKNGNTGNTGNTGVVLTSPRLEEKDESALMAARRLAAAATQAAQTMQGTSHCISLHVDDFFSSLYCRWGTGLHNQRGKAMGMILGDSNS